MSSEMFVCLIIFALMILGFTFSKQIKLSLGIVSLTIIVLVAYSGLVTPSDILMNFSNKNVMLIVGMYIVTAGFNRTQAIKKLSGLVNKISGGNFTIMLAGYCIFIFVLDQFISSPLACFMIVAPILSASCQEFNVSPSKAIYSLGLVGVGCTGVLPIGGGATWYAQMNSYLESYGYTTFQMEMLDLAKGRLPVCIVILLFAIFIAPRFAPGKPSVPITSLVPKNESKSNAVQLSSFREFMGYTVFIATTVGLVFSKQLGLENWQITFTGAAILLLTGVLSSKEAVDAIPIRIALLLISTLTMGQAIVNCGLGDLVGSKLAGIMNSAGNPYLINALFFLIPFVMTQFMQGQGSSAIFRPIIILACKAMMCNPVGPLIVFNCATCASLLTPAATGTIGPMMDAGGYDQIDLLKMGWLPCVVMFVASVVWITLALPL